MPENQRASVRYLTSLPIHGRVCDAQTQKPLSPAFHGMLVDVSEGGARLELDGFGDVMAQLFAENVGVEFRVTSPAVKLAHNIFLGIAWYRSRQEESATTHATVGGRFATVAGEDLAALLQHARGHRGHAGNARTTGGLRIQPAWVAFGITAALAIGIGLDNQRLRREVATLEEGIHAAVTSRLSTPTPTTLPPGALGARAPAPPPEPPGALPPPPPPVVPVAAPTPPPSPAQPLPALVAAADAFREANERERPEPPARLSAAAERGAHALPQGIELSALEILGQDFVGALTSRLPSAQRVSIELSFPCEAEATCHCRIPEIGIAANGRADFSCAPEGAAPRGPARVTARFGE